MERNYLKKQQKALAFLLMSLIVMLMISLMLTNVASANVTDAAYINITVDEAKQMMDKNQSIVILDVRTFAEYKSGHIDGSKLIPLLELEERINAIDGNSAVIVYCGSGVKSEKASKILLDHEFETVYNMIGGLNAWEDAGFPVVSDSNDSFSSEIDDILSSGKPVFLFLYVDWCHFCQEQIPIIDELEQEYKGKIAFILSNCDEHPNAMKEFGASGYPAMFLILGKGDDGQYEYQYLGGFREKETLKESIDWILRERYSGRIYPSSENVGGFEAQREVTLKDAIVESLAQSGNVKLVCPISPPGVLPRGEGCRGACGGGCPSTCTDLSDIYICGTKTPGGIHYVCKYTGVIMCGTHKGCRKHDSCYDKCAAKGVSCPNPLKLCCLRCDAICVAKYGAAKCTSWALGGGPFDGFLTFADAPNLIPCGESTPYCLNGHCVECRTNADCDAKDYYDDWIYYCKGDKVWKHRLFHDFSCKRGTCTERTTRWVDKQFVEDCNDYDYETDWTYYCYMRVREFYDYSCDGGECVLVDIIPEDESCGIVEVDEYYSEEEYNLPPPDVPDNCEVTGVDIVVIPEVIIDYYCDPPVWVNCDIVTYCYQYEDGILEASGDLRCYCDNTGEWEDRGTYTWYGDYFIDEFWVFLIYPDCPWDSQTLSDTPDEEPLSIMSTDNKCFTSQTDGRNEGEQSRNIDIDIGSRIFPYDSATHDIVIDSTVSRALFMIYWSEKESDLSLTINAPSGIVEPSVASTDPSIGYKENAFSKYYMINNPEPGNWSMNITAVSVPTNGLDYNVIMNLVSVIPITLSISTNKDKYNPNEQAIITANLKYNNTPLIEASIVTDILRPDGTVDRLLLFDDGSHGDIQANDGNYSNTYTNTTINGTYDIIITASGTTPDGDFFNRKKSLPIIVATLTAKFNDKYSDYGTDKDGDGLYDYLTIDVGVNVTVAGNYTLIGILSDAEGNNIATAFNHTYLEIGDKAVKLNFDGTELRKHGVDGPYNLKRLILSSVDYMTDAYVTKSYNYTDFQTKLAEFSGTYSDYGTDIDGDGLYDYLTIDVGVNRTTEGDYALNGRLYDVNGNDIAWAINTTHLDNGNQIIQLNFDGRSIHKHGVKGPFYLKYLQIHDKTRKQRESVFDACTTSAYNYRDFQKPLAVFTGAYTDYGIDTEGDDF